MNIKNIIICTLCIALPLSLGWVASEVTRNNIPEWYALLNKPSFNPPNWIFGPVWTVLYILLGISLFLLIQKIKEPLGSLALCLFVIQLCLNFSWSFVFFGFHEIAWALVVIVCMWIFILLMIIVLHKINRTAAYLQIPYLLWVSFATILNFAIWRLQ